MTRAAGPPSRLISGNTYTIRRDGHLHIVSEQYGYKTEPYYTILSHELKGEDVSPDSRSVLDAYVVPLCLLRASRAGIPVADCVIAQECIRFPAILYGLNYFSCTSGYTVVRDPAAAKDLIRHITNSGKYPYCYQPLSADDDVIEVTVIFGRAGSSDDAVRDCADRLYAEFRIPLMTLILIRNKDGVRLSAIAPARYPTLPAAERSLLRSYLSGQVFL